MPQPLMVLVVMVMVEATLKKFRSPNLMMSCLVGWQSTRVPSLSLAKIIVRRWPDDGSMEIIIYGIIHEQLYRAIIY
jgi:hypothetical protein